MFLKVSKAYVVELIIFNFKWSLLSLICASSLNYVFALSRPEVTTKWGTVRGFTVRQGNELVDTYLRIPYAEPPVGPNRFRLPVPIRKYQNVTLEADEFSPSCPEHYTGNDLKRAGKIIVRSEDCLYLNIWVPRSADRAWTDLNVDGNDSYSNRLLPVMVYAHGGGLVMLSASDSKFMDGAHLASVSGVIVVTFNFRIGALGWLFCGSEYTPGNMGLHDTLAAIDWVHSNIINFGGDPKRLTINGLSSGGKMITSLFLGGHLNRYISGLMAHSGIISDVYTEPTSLAYRRCEVISLAAKCRSINQPVDDSVIQCLQNVPTVRLLTAQATLAIEKKKIGFKRTEMFFITTGESLFPVNITVLYQQRKWPQKIPIYISLVTDEASVIERHFPRESPVSFNDYQNFVHSHASTFVPSHPLPEIVAQDLIKSYLLGLKDSSAKLMDISTRRMLGDWYITCPSLYFADQMAASNPVWVSLLRYTVNPKRKDLPPLVAGHTNGTRHGIDVFYYFGVPYYEGQGYDDRDREMSTIMMLIWSRFIKSGKASWTPYQITSTGRVLPFQQILNVNENSAARLNPDRYRCYVWDDLMHNKTPIAAYNSNFEAIDKP